MTTADARGAVPHPLPKCSMACVYPVQRIVGVLWPAHCQQCAMAAARLDDTEGGSGSAA